MAVERITPQLVKKGKGKKRPGYRGPGGYQGGGGRSSRSSGPAGGASAGGNYGGNRNPSQSYGGSGQGGATRPNPHTTSGTSKTSKVSAKDIARSKREFVQNLNHNNAVRAAQTGQKFTPYKGGSRPQGGSLGGLGSLIMSGLGMLMGIPGLGLLTGGFDKLKGGLGSLNDKIQSTDFARSKTLMDYLDAKKYGGIDARDRAASKNMREARAIQTQMGLRPSSTMSPRDYAMAGLQTPQTFSDPFANTVGTTTKVNAPASDAVSSYSYGTADAAIPGVETTTPSYINQFLNKPITPGKSSPFSNFIDKLYNPEQIVELENKFGNAYQIGNSAAGPLSDARHMAAMNNLSNSLSPFDNKFGNFIGDTGAFTAGLINELPALGRGFNKQNLGEIVEDIKANYAGSFGTPNQTTSEDIYNQVFGNQQMAQLGPSFADGGIASMFTRCGGS
jgi:hypothetical protein